MKFVLVVLIAVFGLSHAVDVDKSFQRLKKCSSEQDQPKQVCVEENGSSKFYYIESACYQEFANSLCGGCLDKADDEKCNLKEDDDPSDNDTYIDKCIEKFKSCENNEDGKKSVCVKDDSDNYFELDNQCNVDGANCVCSNCIAKAEESNCNQDNDGNDGN